MPVNFMKMAIYKREGVYEVHYLQNDSNFIRFYSKPKYNNVDGVVRGLAFKMTLIITMTAYNCVKYIETALASLFNQSYTDWRLFLIDDNSTDNTYDIAKLTIEDFGLSYTEQPSATDNIIIHKNSENKGAVYNKSVLFKQYMQPKDEDIVVTLDGDDSLNGSNVLDFIAGIYKDNDCWITYGDYNYKQDTPRYALPIDWNVPIRKQGFKYAQLRTYKWFLYKNISMHDMTDLEGKFFKFPEDWVFMLPMLEMAGEKHTLFINEPLYNYTVHPQCDNFIHAQEGNIVRYMLLQAPPYDLATKEQLIEQECDFTPP